MLVPQRILLYFNDSISNTNERFCKCYILRIHVSIISYRHIGLFSVCSVYLLLDGAVAIHQTTSLKCKKIVLPSYDHLFNYGSI